MRHPAIAVHRPAAACVVVVLLLVVVGLVAPTPASAAPGTPTITSPVAGATLAAGPTTLRGRASATDAVGRVDVAVYDRDARTWLQRDGGFRAAFAVLPADVADEGRAASAWSLEVVLAPGRYVVNVTGRDADGDRSAIVAHDVVVAGADNRLAHGGLVPDRVRADTLRVLDGKVLGLAQSGDTVVVGGRFRRIQRPDGEVLPAANLTAWDVDTGDVLPGFRPDVDGEVAAVAATDDGGFVVGGEFDTVDGRPRGRLARFDAAGRLDPDFTPSIGGAVEAVDVVGDTVFVAGGFADVDGVPRSTVAAFDLHTGRLLPSLDVAFTEGIGTGGFCRGRSIAADGDASRLLVGHSCRRVDGRVRTGLVRLDRVDGRYVVSGWSAPVYERERAGLGGQIAFQKTAVDPDFTYAVTVTKSGDRPPVGDSATAFPLAGDGPVEPRWTSRNFDSTYSVAISDAVVYIGGHFQYVEGPLAPDPYPGDPRTNHGFGNDLGGARVLGGQALARQQVAALDPATGHALPWNPGADGQEAVLELAVTSRGLLLGHDGGRVQGRKVGRAALFDLAEAPDVPDVPAVVFANPRRFEHVTAGPVHLSGRVTPTDADRVEVEAGNGRGAFLTRQDARLTPLAVGTRGWQLSAPFGPGHWTIRARAVVDGTAGPWSDTTLVVTGELGAQPPTSTITAPTGPAIPTGRTTFTGRASDDVGVATVRLSAQELASKRYLQADGSLGDTFALLPAVLSNPGAIDTGWTRDLELTEGRWRIEARPTDDTGLSPSSPTSVEYVVADGAAPPVAFAVDGVAEGRTTTDRRPTIRARFGDDRGVAGIQVRLVQTLGATRSWDVAADRLVDVPNARWFDVPADGLGTREATATVRPPTLSLGAWRLQVRAVDDQGLVSPDVTVGFVVGVADDDPPRVDLTSLAARQAGFPSRTITVAGEATDDRGVVRLGLQVRGVDFRLAGRTAYLQPDGTFAPVATFVDLPVVTGAGTRRATFSRTVTLPADSAYDVFVVAYDDAGQPTSRARWDREFVRVFVFPGDAVPEVVLQNPVPGAAVRGGRISLDGSASDDGRIRRVEAFVREVDTGLGPAGDGTLGAPVWLDVTAVNNPGRARTIWSHVTPDLPPGTYEVRVRVVDDVDQLSAVARAVVTLDAPR